MRYWKVIFNAIPMSNQTSIRIFDKILGQSTNTFCVDITLWRHQMGTLSASLALCAGNSPVTGEFPTHRPVPWSFDVFFDLNKRLSKQSWGRWFETPSHSLWRHCNERALLAMSRCCLQTPYWCHNFITLNHYFTIRHPRLLCLIQCVFPPLSYIYVT